MRDPHQRRARAGLYLRCRVVLSRFLPVLSVGAANQHSRCVPCIFMTATCAAHSCLLARFHHYRTIGSSINLEDPRFIASCLDPSAFPGFVFTCS